MLRLDKRHARLSPKATAQLEVFSSVNLTLKQRRDRGAGRPSPARASRRCCTWPACWKRPRSGEVFIDGAARRRSAGRGAHRASAATRSALSIRPIICCRNSTRWRTSSLPQLIAGKSRADGRRGSRAACSTLLGLGERADAPAGAAVRRRAAARRHRPRAGQQPARASGRRAHRQSRSRAPQAACSTP